MKTRTALVLALLALATATPQAQGVDHEGTEFVIGFLRNNGGNQSSTPSLHLTALVATDVRVRHPMDGSYLDTIVSVTPGAVTAVDLSPFAGSLWQEYAAVQNSVLVESQSAVPVTCVMANLRLNTCDTALALPTDALGVEYLVIEYHGNTNSTFGSSDVLVVATVDGTEVLITPSVQAGTTAAGQTTSITLDRGEGYLLSSPVGAPSLSGTRIVSSAPVFVANGNRCSNVPVGVSACDHLFEVAHPVDTWGTEFVLANLPERPDGTVYGILAQADDTTVIVDGAEFATLDAGEYLYTESIAGNRLLSSDKPTFVAQFLTSYWSPGASSGDPSMGNVLATSQFQNSYTFSTVGGTFFPTHYATLTVPVTILSDVLLDGVQVDPTLFSTVPLSPFAVATVEVPLGDHTLVAPEPFGVTLSGFEPGETYLHSPGIALSGGSSSSGGDGGPPIVELVVQSTSSSIGGVARDDRPDEDTNGNGVLDPGEDLNGNGQIDSDSGLLTVDLSTDSSGLTLYLQPFAAGDPSTSFSLVLDSGVSQGSGEIVARDLTGKTTRVPVAIDLNGAALYLGATLAGTNDEVPTITAPAVSIGSNFSVELQGAPDVPGLLVFGTSQIAFPFRQGLVHVWPITLFPFATDATGAGSVDFGLASDPSLAGYTYLWQAAFLDSGAIESVSFTTLMATIF